MSESDRYDVASRPTRTRSPQRREADLRTRGAAAAVPVPAPCANETGADAPVCDGESAPPAAELGLVARARRGDRAALEALLQEARPRALAVALKVLRNPDDAEDAVQDAFLKVWRNLARFEGRSSFSTWVHRIVMNTSLDLLRRQACRPGAAATEDEAERNERAPEVVWEETPERAVFAAERSRLLHTALTVLSPAHRQAVTLREFEDCSYEEIARVSACPVGTVMSRLHHARKKLAEELSGGLYEEVLNAA